MTTATQTLNEIRRIDLRRMRMLPLVHAMLKATRPYLANPEDERYLYDELAQMLHDEGAEIITDQMRADLGLAPRGPDGWTGEEIVALEKRRLEVLTAPIYAPLTIVTNTKT